MFKKLNHMYELNRYCHMVDYNSRKITLYLAPAEQVYHQCNITSGASNLNLSRPASEDASNAHFTVHGFTKNSFVLHLLESSKIISAVPNAVSPPNGPTERNVRYRWFTSFYMQLSFNAIKIQSISHQFFLVLS